MLKHLIFLILHIPGNYFSENIFLYFVLEYVDELMRVAVELCVQCEEEMSPAIQVHPHLTSTVD